MSLAIKLLAAAKGRGNDDGVEVQAQVAQGVVVGRQEGDLAVFRGIPYAVAPVRFGAPQPPPAWSGQRPARAFGPPPPQSGVVGDSESDGNDWLTVNVWSPDLTGSLPVMVWIQGGGYLFGTSGLPEYDGSRLAADGVVVVTFNYRVGFEGFGFIAGSPTNRGLLDQVAALTWVRDNITAFGGNPRQVTVFGQSAGAGCLAALLVMPRAQGLIHRAIVQSMPGAFFTPALAEDVTTAVAGELGCAPKELAELDPSMLTLASDAVLGDMARHGDRWGRAAYAGIPYAPIVDGDTLPSTPWQGLDGSIDLIVGHTRHEQRLLTLMAGHLGMVTRAQCDESLAVFAPDPERYRDLWPDREECHEVVRSDWLFRMPSLKLAEAQVAAGGRAFLYELTWPAPGMGGAVGACHGLDVPLVFGNLTAGATAMLIGEPSAQAYALSEQMRSSWTRYAATGDPGWSPFDGTTNGAVRVFDVEPSVTTYPEADSRQIWASIVDLGALDLASAPVED